MSFVIKDQALHSQIFRFGSSVNLCHSCVKNDYIDMSLPLIGRLTFLWLTQVTLNHPFSYIAISLDFWRTSYDNWGLRSLSIYEYAIIVVKPFFFLVSNPLFPAFSEIWPAFLCLDQLKVSWQGVLLPVASYVHKTMD